MTISIPLLQKGALVDLESGAMAPHHEGTFSQLFTQLQNNLTPNGYVIPALTTDGISKIPLTPTTNLLVINSDTNQLKICLNGVFKTIQVA